MKEKNICMFCAKKSKNRMEHRVLKKKNEYRDFCSTKCLLKYYKLVLEEQTYKSNKTQSTEKGKVKK